MTPEQTAEKLMDDWLSAEGEDEGDLEHRISQAIAQARADMREECARTVEQFGVYSYPNQIAAAIRKIEI